MSTATNLPFDVSGTPLSAWQASTALARTPAMDLEALVPAGTRLVVLAPHPDDEVLACGGLVAALHGEGRELVLISATDGDASHPGSAAWPVERLREQRRLESTRAMARLGWPAEQVEWHRLALPDGQLGTGEAALQACLASLLRPGDRLLTTWRLDGHCDHEAAGRVAARVAAQREAVLLEAPIWAWHWATPEDARLPWPQAAKFELGPDELASKRQAILEHTSQLLSDPSTLAPPILDEATLSRLLQPFELFFVTYPEGKPA